MLVVQVLELFFIQKPVKLKIKLPDTRGLVTTTAFNKKIRASKDKVSDVSRLSATTALSDVEKKMDSVGDI